MNSFRSALDDVPPLWLVPWPLACTDLWPALCQTLSGTHDYTAFVHKDERARQSHLLTVRSIDYQVQNERVCECHANSSIVTAQFQFHATGFRRGMVRHLVGFFVQCARRRNVMSEDDDDDANTNDSQNNILPVENLWNDLELYWKQYIESAPASGLCLESVTYNDDNDNSPKTHCTKFHRL